MPWVILAVAVVFFFFGWVIGVMTGADYVKKRHL